MQAVASQDVPTAAPSRPRRPKPRRRFPPEVLTDLEVRALLDACGRYHPIALRNRALIVLMYRAGLRVSEALALQPKDVDLAAGTLRVLHGKGDRARTVGIDAGAAEIVAEWIRIRSRLPISSRPPVVCTLGGLPLVTGYVRKLLPRLAARAGIEKRVHAHGLRHTHAAQLRSERIDVGIISKQLGHRSILTTIRYLDHIAPVEVVEAVRRRMW
jgi:integrase